MMSYDIEKFIRELSEFKDTHEDIPKETPPTLHEYWNKQLTKDKEGVNRENSDDPFK